MKFSNKYFLLSLLFVASAFKSASAMRFTYAVGHNDKPADRLCVNLWDNHVKDLLEENDFEPVQEAEPADVLFYLGATSTNFFSVNKPLEDLVLQHKPRYIVILDPTFVKTFFGNPSRYELQFVCSSQLVIDLPESVLDYGERACRFSFPMLDGILQNDKPLQNLDRRLYELRHQLEEETEKEAEEADQAERCAFWNQHGNLSVVVNVLNPDATPVRLFAYKSPLI